MGCDVKVFTRFRQKKCGKSTSDSNLYHGDRDGRILPGCRRRKRGTSMSDQVFQQNLNDKKGPQPGGPYLIQMLFKEPVPMPDKETMTAVMEKHIGAVECFCHDKKTAGFAALDHIAEFRDGKCQAQLMVMGCDLFKGKGFDAFLMSQMWDCQADRERIFRECRYQVIAVDTMAAALPALERADLDADFAEALAELYPTCEAFYFKNCGKLLLAEDVRSNQIEGADRFIRFGVNVRFFKTRALRICSSTRWARAPCSCPTSSIISTAWTPTGW